MNKSKTEPKAIHQITPEEIVKLHGGKFSLNTARRRINRVIYELELERNFITIKEYCDIYKLPIADVLGAVG
mgnify:CR=1 FL=1